MARRNDKRCKLEEAAETLFHRQGVSNTTLANIAELAGVPLGNVYYYFKSKDSIIIAVIERRKRALQSLFSQWDMQSDVKSRLGEFIQHAVSLGETAAQYGDALGGLCQELGKMGGSIAESGASLMRVIMDWCESQFKSLGKTDGEAEKLALNLISGIQGINIITLTFKDPGYLLRQTQFLRDWLQTL